MVNIQEQKLDQFNENNDIPEPNGSFFYRGNDIVKLWEQYLKSFNLAIRFYDKEGQEVDSLFHAGSITQIKEVAIVINEDGTPYQNKDGRTITLCGEVDHSGENAQYIRQAIEQIKVYNAAYPNKVENHIIIFPYHVTDVHWNLGKIDLKLSVAKQDETSISEASITIYEPYGSDAIKHSNYSNLISNVNLLDALQEKKVILKDLSKFHEHIEQQHDGSSCGAITAENGKEFLKRESNGINLLKTIYPSWAKVLRTSHINEIKDQAFADAQHHNKVYEAKGDKAIGNQSSIIDSLKKLILQSENNWVIEVLSLINSQDTNISRDNVGFFKEFLIKRNLSGEIDSKVLHSLIAPENGYWQEGALGLIASLTQSIQEDNMQEESNMSSHPILSQKQPVYYLSGVKHDGTETYEVTTKNKLFTENKELYKSIKNVLKNPEVKDLVQFHTEVYKSLWEGQEAEKTKYMFKYIYQQKEGNQVNIGESDNLIFWLLNNTHNCVNRIKSIINTYKLNVTTVQDNNNNNLLHIAALYQRYDFIKMIFSKYKYKDKELLSSLINHRNQDGTTPLGMLFLDYKHKSYRDIIKIAKLFIAEELFEVNSFFNNKKGMDCLEEGFLKEVGGFNILHMAIIKDLPEILHALNKRNDDLGWKKNPNHICNFLYPSLNPKSHMWSSDKLYQKYKQDNEVLEEKLNLYIQKQIQKEDEDDSGDSSDEGSPAYYYKQQLLDLVKVISHLEIDKSNNDNFQEESKEVSTPSKSKISETKTYRKIEEKDIDNVLIPHFHGVPFMQGQYTNYQRREIAKKLVGINKNSLFFEQEEKQDTKESIEKVKVDLDPRTKALHSRTATANVSMETLYHLVESSQDKLKDLEKIDGTLINRDLLNQEDFLKLIEIYTFNFSESNSMQQFWNKASAIDMNIIKYRFPCISASKAPDHAVKFAIGKNVETQSKGEKPLYPKYNTDGYPKHRLAGLLYITLHKAQDLLELEDNNKAIDITKKYKTTQISLGKGDLYILYQLECNFWGYIGHENVAAIIPIIYPNFNKEFNTSYHNEVWGFVNEGKPNLANYFNKAKTLFKDKEFLPLYAGNGPVTPAGKVLMPAFVELGVKLASGIAQSQGSTLGYFDPEGALHKYPIEYVKGDKYWSQAQINIKEYIDSKGSAKGKIKLTPKQLRSNEDSSRKKPIDTKSSSFSSEVVKNLDFGSVSKSKNEDIDAIINNNLKDQLSELHLNDESNSGISGDNSPIFDEN